MTEQLAVFGIPPGLPRGSSGCALPGGQPALGLPLPGILDCPVSGARGRQEAIRQLVGLGAGWPWLRTLRYIQAVATNCSVAQQVPAYELQVNPPNRTLTDHALFDFETCPGNTVYLEVTAIRAGTLGT